MADNKLIPQFAKETDSFKTNEVMISGNFSTGQVYTREPSVFANNIAEELGIESLKDKSIGEEQGDIPIWYSIGNGQGVVMYASNGSIAVNDTNNAFNRPFGGTGTESTVARSDHSHSELVNTLVYKYEEIFTTGAAETTKTITASDFLDVLPAGTTYVSPGVNVELMSVSGDVCGKINIDTDNMVVTKTSTTITQGVAHALSEIEIRGLSSSTTYLISVDIRPGRLLVLTSGGSSRE